MGHRHRPCFLLDWTVSYFYEHYKLLTVSVMTAQVSLILSSPSTNSIRLVTALSLYKPAQQCFNIGMEKKCMYYFET